MGLAKSLRKAGHLGSVKDNLMGIAEMLEANRKKKEQQEMYNTVVNLFDKFQEGQREAEMPVNLKEGGQVANVFSSDRFTGGLSDPESKVKEPTGLNLKVNIPENIQEQMATTPTPPETQTREIPQRERYEKGQQNLNELITAVMPVLMNPNADGDVMSRVNALTGLAEKQAGQLKPKEVKGTQIDPYKETGYWDDSGNFVVTKGAKEKPVSSKLEGSYKNPKTGTYWKYDGVNREGVDTGIPYDKTEGRSTVNVNTTPEYGKLLGDVNKGIKIVEAIKDKWEKDGDLYYPTPDSKYHKTNKEGQTIGYTEKEYRAIKEGEKANYLASSIQLINEQGLDNAVEIIRGGISKGKPFDEVIKEFKKVNSEFDKEDERIVRDYFKLMSL